MRIVVLVSGTGSNLQAVIDAVKSGELDVEIAAVGADRPDTYGVERSDEAGIETFVVNFNSFETREEWDTALRDNLNGAGAHEHLLQAVLEILAAGMSPKIPKQRGSLGPVQFLKCAGCL